MTSKLYLASMLMTASLAVGSPAAAAVLFTISDPGNTSPSGDPTITFELPATPSFVDPGSDFYYDQVPATINGAPGVLHGLTFYNINALNGANVGGGLGDTRYVALAGAQYYTGSEAAPVFAAGVFSRQVNYFNGNVDTVTITVSSPGGVQGVPEPATWALMTLGVLGLGAALRRRREGLALAA